MVKRHNLLECSYADCQEWFKETDTVMVPVGSCEKHGAHLPLGTDSFTTIAVTEKAAKLANVPYTPLLSFGYPAHHIKALG